MRGFVSFVNGVIELVDGLCTGCIGCDSSKGSSMYKDFSLLRRRRRQNRAEAMRINPPRVPKMAPTITGVLDDRELPTLPEGRVIVP